MSQVWHNPNSQSNDVATSNDAAGSNERNERNEKEPLLQGNQSSFVQQQQRITLPSLSALNNKEENGRDSNGQLPLASHGTHILGYPPTHPNIIPSITSDSTFKQSHEYQPHPKSSSSSPSINTSVMNAASASAPAPLPTAGGASFSLSRFDNPLPINAPVHTEGSQSYNCPQEEEKASQQTQDHKEVSAGAQPTDATKSANDHIDTNDDNNNNNSNNNNENFNEEDPDYRPLNVKDALSYLEPVSYTHLDVYKRQYLFNIDGSKRSNS